MAAVGSRVCHVEEEEEVAVDERAHRLAAACTGRASAAAVCGGHAGRDADES